MSQSSHGTDNCRANCAINCKTRRQRNKQREKEERASKRVRERERSDPQNATCCMRWGTGHTVNLFVLSVAKSRALNSRFVEGVEKAFAQRKREEECGGEGPQRHYNQSS